MFHIIILYISLDIQNGIFGFFWFFRFFGLSVRVRLITFRVRICFVPPYKIYSDIFYISDRVRIGFLGSDFGLWILCRGLTITMIHEHYEDIVNIIFYFWCKCWTGKRRIYDGIQRTLCCVKRCPNSACQRPQRHQTN